MKKIYKTPDEYIAHVKEVRNTFPSVIAKSYGRDIVAYDGEGIGTLASHRYVLLMNDKEDVLEERVKYQGISTQAAFNFLMDCKRKYPNALHVGYGLGYDVNMILKGVDHDVPLKHLKILVRNKRVFWRNYEIEFIPRRFFRVSRYPREYGDKRGLVPEESIIIWDFLGFFQESFVEALQGCFTDIELRDLGLGQIMEGKAGRGSFTEHSLDNGYIKAYTLKETQALAALAGRLRSDCLASGIRLKRYDGAGAAAASLLQSNNIGIIVKKSNMLLPDGLERAGQIAYGGGRAELFKFGHTDEEVWHGDIISAFPSVMPDMPDLSKGMWVHHDFDDPFAGRFTLCKVYWDFRYILDQNGKRHHRNPFQTMFPFFYRMPWQEPRVFYPPQGYTWMWKPEYDAAYKHKKYLGGEVHMLESWEFMPSDYSRPFEFVNDLYAKRLQYKLDGFKGQALAVKLATNAMPGKMAQSKGYSGIGENGEGGKGAGGKSWGLPPYYNILYAGYITSCIRAEVFNVAMQDPSAIIAIATDGIWSTRPLKVDEGTWMGQWEVEKLDGFTSIQAGIYFSRKKDGENVYHYRGFNQGSIREEDVISKWADKGYSIQVPTRRFVTMGTATASEAMYWDKWATWQDEDRKLQIQPNMMLKRQVMLGRDARPTEEAAYKLIDTTASHVMMFEDNIKTWQQFQTGVDRWDQSVETYLSRRHDVPWEEQGEITETQRYLDEQEAISDEVTDSEV